MAQSNDGSKDKFIGVRLSGLGFSSSANASTQPRLGFSDGFNQFFDHLIRIDFFGLGLEIEKDAMAQHGLSHCANVVARNVIAPVQYGARLAGQDQELRRAKRSAPRHPAIDEIGS